MHGDQGGFVTVTETATRISLELNCQDDMCRQFAAPLLEHLEHGYEVCAVQAIPPTVGHWRWTHRSARKRSDRASRRGYVAMSYRREDHEDAIHAINNSTPRRQGRPMSPSYRAPTHFSPLPSYPCARHAIRTTGIFEPGGILVGYLTMYRAGQLALVSQILGHAAHLENEIMFALFQRALERECARGPGMVVYNRWDSGTDGLRTHKRLLGFVETEVEWAP